MVATATDSVDSSVADVVASIGSLKVANLDILEHRPHPRTSNVLTGLGDTVSNLLNTGSVWSWRIVGRPQSTKLGELGLLVLLLNSGGWEREERTGAEASGR